LVCAPPFWFLANRCHGNQTHIKHTESEFVILSEVGAHATRSRRIPTLPIVTMPHQGVLSIPHVPPFLAVCDGFYYNFPTSCLVENQHTEIKHTESEFVILSEVGAHATRSRRIPTLPIVTMPHQGVLSIPHVLPSLAVRDGFHYNFPTFCLVENQHTEIKHTESEFGHPERSRRACDAQSKDPDTANCDHAASSVLSIPHVPPSL
jgi:hypothetical protein